jgi:hypothetical protein
MHKGEFFELYFQHNFAVKDNGEANVCCPFLHDKGYDSRPSAHIHLEKGLFHCKTCFAEGRLDSGGLSEIGFIAMVYGITYEEALQMYKELTGSSEIMAEKWDETVALLHNNPAYLDYLKDERGLSEETIRQYRLGFKGDGIAYPIFIHEQLCDIRTYHPNQTPKITSNKGASPLLFPFDHWRADSQPTLLVAGENDCLLTRQNGFNALTVTAGEGSFPKIFGGLFRGKKVYICYDCDEAGRNSSRRVAFILKEFGAEVYLLDLGLSGTKEDKDLTDYFMKHSKSSADLYQLMQDAQLYDGSLYQADKNEHYPLVDLWDVPEGHNSGKRLSSRVVLSAKYDTAMQTPSAIEWKCRGEVPGNEACQACSIKGQEGMWTLHDTNLKDVMKLVEVDDDKQRKSIRRACGLPDKCPNGSTTIKARKSVYKVVFTPDVETEDILSGFRSVEQYAYTVGINLDDGQRYRAFFRSYAHPLDGQRVYMIVDRIEESDNALNVFRMNDAIAEQLKVFQGEPFSVMSEKGKRMHGIPNMFSEPDPMIAATVNIVYHSPLRFKFRGNELKGYPEAAIVGESRIGKSETAKQFQRYVQIGNYMEVKGATTAALLGGADKLANGNFKIAWGIVPQNHKGLVVLDEMSGMPREVFSSLTAMRSERIATVPKIKRGRAPAETRLLWIGNPRAGSNGQSTAVKDYPNGVTLVLDLIGSDEDVARFDFFVLAVKSKQQSPLDKPELDAFPADVYRNLIYWAWTRTSDQILFEPGVEEYVVQVASELNEKYDTDVKFFGTEAWKKLARIAVSVAINCFSVRDDDSNCLSVRKEHVDWAADFLSRCYDNNLFRLREYARERRSYTETNEAVNTIVAGICRTNPMVIKALLNSTNHIPMSNLQSVAGLESQQYRELINQLSMHNLIHVSAQGATATRRLRLAVDVYREDYQKSNMIPLSKEGVNPV